MEIEKTKMVGRDGQGLCLNGSQKGWESEDDYPLNVRHRNK